MPALAVICGYFIGSIPFALLGGKLGGVPDIRRRGSSNMGTLNVLRVAGFLPAVLTLILDLGKGVSAAYLGGLIAGVPVGALAAMFGAVLGHMLPVYAGFKGGKSIAVYVGAMAYLAPVVLVFLGVVWSALFFFRRKVALASALTFLSVPLLVFFYGFTFPFILFSSLAGVAMACRHWPDIKRGR